MIDEPSIDHTSLRIQGFVIGLVFWFIGLAVTYITSDAVKKRDRALGAGVGTVVGVTLFIALQA